MSAQEKPFAWAYQKKEGLYPTFSLNQEWPVGMAKLFGGKVISLYKSPTLTDAQREAVDTAEASLMRESTNRNTPEPVRQRFGAAVNTLRGLLERLK